MPPDRLQEIAEALERGEPIDLKRLAALQALDLAAFGRQFVEAAIQRDEEADEHFRAQHGAVVGE